MTSRNHRRVGPAAAGLAFTSLFLAACGASAPRTAAGSPAGVTPPTRSATSTSGPAASPSATTPAAQSATTPAAQSATAPAAQSATSTTTAAPTRPASSPTTTATPVRNTVPPASTTTAPTTSSTSTTAPGGSVTAVETEYHIALSRSSLTPGRWVFTARNSGSLSHNLVVNGPGVSQDSTPLIAPGQSAQLTVTLQKGTYDVYCGVPGHKEAGMDVTVTVG